MNARAEQLRVTQMNRSSKNRRDSCAAEEVCPIRGMSVEKTLATAGVVRDNTVIGRVVHATEKIPDQDLNYWGGGVLAYCPRSTIKKFTW
jgi:hypothetical protein